MIIEFIGLPGSGKSYLSKKILHSLKKIQKEIIFENRLNINKLTKFYFLLRFCIKNFSLCFIFTFFYLTNKTLNEKKKKLYFYWIKKEIIAFEYCKKYRKILLRSEGFHHRFWMYLANIGKNKISNLEMILLKLIPVPDKIIMIFISKKKSIIAVKKRKKGFRYDINSFNKIDLKIKILKKIRKFFLKEHKFKFICINNHKNQNFLVKSLKKYVINS